MFEACLAGAKNYYKESPVIKTPDLKRPAEGVHSRGVMLFYEIYRKYGAEKIIKILQILSGLNVKTTDIFLAELKNQMDDDIPAVIERGLLIKDYSDLV